MAKDIKDVQEHIQKINQAIIDQKKNILAAMNQREDRFYNKMDASGASVPPEDMIAVQVEALNNQSCKLLNDLIDKQLTLGKLVFEVVKHESKTGKGSEGINPVGLTDADIEEMRRIAQEQMDKGLSKAGKKSMMPRS